VTARPSQLEGLPSAEDIRAAIRIYFEHAWVEPPPERLQMYLPPEGFDPLALLMGDRVERTPAGAVTVEEVRSFALRIGNEEYPNMKLRLARPPEDRIFLFGVDAHDARLHAPPGSPDAAALEELKKHNAHIVAQVTAAWDEANLPTERSYLRAKIRQARADQGR
jgi:hypothetical protein